MSGHEYVKLSGQYCITKTTEDQIKGGINNIIQVRVRIRLVVRIWPD
jgi:hypothetical protein